MKRWIRLLTILEVLCHGMKDPTCNQWIGRFSGSWLANWIANKKPNSRGVFVQSFTNPTQFWSFEASPSCKNLIHQISLGGNVCEKTTESKSNRLLFCCSVWFPQIAPRFWLNRPTSLKLKRHFLSLWYSQTLRHAFFKLQLHLYSFKSHASVEKMGCLPKVRMFSFTSNNQTVCCHWTILLQRVLHQKTTQQLNFHHFI